MFSNISKKNFFLTSPLFLLSSYVIGAGAGSLTSAAAEGNWGLSFHEENTPPTANASTDELAQYDAYYMQDTDEKNTLSLHLMQDTKTETQKKF